MNTTQLRQYMQEDPRISRYYGGVCAIDQLPTIINAPKLYIVNSDPSTKPGEHWLALWIAADTCEYFDSSGQKPKKELEPILILNSLNYKYNHRRLQSYNSNVCGQYCLVYCYYKSRGFKFEAFMKMFSSDLVDNDSIVRNFVNK